MAQSPVAKNKTFFGRKSSAPLIKSIGKPENVKHHVHVDLDYNWTGEDPSEAFIIEKKLGEGAYGAVYKATHRETGITLALKKVKVPGKGVKDQIKQEIDLLKKCRHNNIVSYWGCCFFQNELWILMDYCGVGSVLDLIGDNDEKVVKILEKGQKYVKEEQIAAVLASVVKGLVYLHAKGIVHRDIKCANILINDKGEAKIADFGVSAQLGTGGQSLSYIGTPLWMAPEIVQGEGSIFQPSADIWSLGITAIEFAQGKPPYWNENVMRAVFLLGTRDSPTLEEPSLFSDEFNDFIAKCLQKDPKERPTAIDLMLHPFITGAKEPSVALRTLLIDYQLFLEEQEAASEKWIITVKTTDLQLKTPFSPTTPVKDVVTKLTKKFPNISDTNNYGLYYEPELLWFEDAKNLFYYRKYFKENNNHEEITVELKMRSSNKSTFDGKWKIGAIDSSSLLKERADSEEMKKTISELSTKYQAECEKTASLTALNAELQKQLELAKTEIRKLKEDRLERSVTC